MMEKGGEMVKAPQQRGHSHGKKQSSLEALTPSNPGHQRSLQKMLSEADELINPTMDQDLKTELFKNSKTVLSLHIPLTNLHSNKPVNSSRIVCISVLLGLSHSIKTPSSYSF